MTFEEVERAITEIRIAATYGDPAAAAVAKAIDRTADAMAFDMMSNPSSASAQGLAGLLD